MSTKNETIQKLRDVKDELQVVFSEFMATLRDDADSGYISEQDDAKFVFKAFMKFIESPVLPALPLHMVSPNATRVFDANNELFAEAKSTEAARAIVATFNAALPAQPEDEEL